MQNITGKFFGGMDVDLSGAFYWCSTDTTSGYGGGSMWNGVPKGTVGFNSAREARSGTTTHGKQKGVNYIIKY